MEDVSNAATGKVPSQYAAWSPGKDSTPAKAPAAVNTLTNFNWDSDSATPAASTSSAANAPNDAAALMAKMSSVDDGSGSAAASAPSAAQSLMAKMSAVDTDSGGSGGLAPHPHHDEFMDDDDPPTPHRVAPGTPKGFEGGWRSMLKPQKPHKVVDPSSGILDLVQTPSAYSAWKPGGGGGAAAPPPAVKSLLAAKKAFDFDDFLQLTMTVQHRVRPVFDEDPLGALVDDAILNNRDAGEEDVPGFLLERSSTSVDTGTVNAAAVVLDEYATTLQSAPLLQLSRARLSLPRLLRLWQVISSVNTTASSAGHDAQAVKWCQDFRKESASLAVSQKAMQQQAADSLAAAETKVSVLQQEVAAQEQMLAVFDRDVQSLKSLQDQVQHQFDSAQALIQDFRREASSLISRAGGRADVAADIGSLEENLGKGEGLVSAGGMEVLDMVQAMISKRSEEESNRRSSAARVRDDLVRTKQDRESLLQRSASQAQASVQNEKLQSRYEQMCGWTLDGLQQKQHRQECEKDAIHAALIILSAK